MTPRNTDSSSRKFEKVNSRSLLRRKRGCDFAVESFCRSDFSRRGVGEEYTNFGSSNTGSRLEISFSLTLSASTADVTTTGALSGFWEPEIEGDNSPSPRNTFSTQDRNKFDKSLLETSWLPKIYPASG